MRRGPLRSAVACAALVWLASVGVSEPRVAAQAPREQQIWDGVFSAAQAARGKTGFETSCGRCHNNQLLGSERGPALTGDGFWTHWDNDTLDKLFTKIRDTMPAGGVDTVNDASKLDILTYILSANGAKPGTAELAADLTGMQGIAIVKPGGTRGVSNFSLAQVVGCLTRDGDRRWTLTSAGDPVATRDESATPASLAQARTAPLGTSRYRLVSVVPAYNADALAGQKVDARGLIYRSESDSLLNLTGLQGTGTACQAAAP